MGPPRHRSENPSGEGERAGSERIKAFGAADESKLRHDSPERLTADYADITDVQNQTVAAFVVYYAGYADNLSLRLACIPRRS